ncbi:MAG TPA: TonB-dependent receptor, partial [Candidatus Nitrosotalea sp.]|nr:TonB-dependent receptor [Candidatus Nitrosotalea sp.]
APERTRVGDATIAAPTLWGGVTFGWFAMSGSNLIVSPPPLYIPENVGHASIAGVTLGITTPPAHGYVANLDVTNLYRAQDLDTQTRLPGRGPVFSASLGLRYLAPPASRFDGFRIVAHTQGPQESSDPFLSPAYSVYQPATFTTVDGSIGYRVAPRLTLTLRGFNLGNERYAIYAGFPMTGRSFAVELRGR